MPAGSAGDPWQRQGQNGMGMMMQGLQAMEPPPVQNSPAPTMELMGSFAEPGWENAEVPPHVVIARCLATNTRLYRDLQTMQANIDDLRQKLAAYKTAAASASAAAAAAAQKASSSPPPPAAAAPPAHVAAVANIAPRPVPAASGLNPPSPLHGVSSGTSPGSHGGGGGGMDAGGLGSRVKYKYWNEVEEGRFLEGLGRFGKRNVRRIAEVVGTRSAAQVRAHLQNHEKKVLLAEKAAAAARAGAMGREGGEDGSDEKVGGLSSSRVTNGGRVMQPMLDTTREKEEWNVALIRREEAVKND
mmetsp:Transcript_10989/g.28933  ORF Transcript_10989/g.28933 Transcript_10989/m.28933 type:complete len:301 (-) Transcript_10989:95-997(-)